MQRIGVLGATGYTALELLKRLHRHPQADVVAVTSRQEDRPHLSRVHSQLRSLFDLTLEATDVPRLAERADVVFSCLPHAASAETVKPLVDAGVRVIDFSADYRLDQLDAYHQWYGGEHPDPQRVGKVPYGLPELFAEQIRGAALVANPGCFPTAAILALYPLLQRGLISADGLIVDSKTGVSGAGRTPKLAFHYPECNESLMAYNVGGHRHTPEIDQILGQATSAPVQALFTPHLAPMDRGILTTCYATPEGELGRRNFWMPCGRRIENTHLCEWWRSCPPPNM